MYWLFLPLALAAFVLAFSTPHMSLLVLALLAALGFLLAWARGWSVAKIGDASQRDAAPMIDPAELRRLREHAEARRAAAAAASDDAISS
ncbi:hypothetical protein FZ025_08865 [Xanthomonas hyacinthi]|uniref:Uncharacterized protein n=1 Tax=Xanthomonas hyacinthi TaxID=56455 RepID=A0A2S7EYF9_9XANT|nr:hypothetical protein [Xanthomonas hyacinthi]KLD80120.1 membrane protein [Xanthomonas hyacinthi DSM 19077]PPU98192.1 hypothetical protein XhyaCFBP1156_08275 [Xanthomonas hyacinthi]QGY76759.1 hypothetical protein FZ025_08865 [Xanthomonas hyacinthi]